MEEVKGSNPFRSTKTFQTLTVSLQAKTVSAEDLEQQFGPGLGQRHEAQLVDDQQLEVGEHLLEAHRPRYRHCFSGRGVTSAFVMPIAHLIASSHIVCIARLSHDSSVWPNVE